MYSGTNVMAFYRTPLPVQLDMEVADTTERLVLFYQFTRRHTPDKSELPIPCFESLRTHLVAVFYASRASLQPL
jgi:hypothetical protein